MKPFRIFLFFLAVFGILLVVAFVFPKEGIALGEELKLRFASGRDLILKDSVKNNYTDSLILAAITVTDDPEAGMLDTLFLAVDSLQVNSDTTLPEFAIDSLVLARIDSISQRVYPIAFANGSKEKLGKFFDRAEDARIGGRVLRILHYGDSQIENDRMTSLLRYRFQKIFGGYGVGMVPAIPLYFGNPTFRESHEGNWIRYTGFGKRDTTLGHHSYGTMVCFTSVPLPREEKLPELEFRFVPGRRASRFSQIKLYLHAYVDSGKIYVMLNDTIRDTLHIHDGYQVLKYRPPAKTGSVRMQFEMKEGGRIYGIAFDPTEGVQVDNIAMRGSSGTDLSRSDRQVLDTMMQALNPGLILMQFGGNVVPYINNFSYYKSKFKRELAYLRKLCPEVPVIVIGPSDMATKEDGKFVTYPTVEPVRDVLREAALESGCAFWDMYEAMGGHNSIQDFVEADPPLATSDYIHFTPKGANMMAGMFFDAVMLEYSRHKASQEARNAAVDTP